MAADQRLHGRAQQRVPGYQTQSSRLPFQRISDHHAVLYRRQAPLAPFLIPPKTAENRKTVPTNCSPLLTSYQTCWPAKAALRHRAILLAKNCRRALMSDDVKRI